uniref:Uncharacterized protein n=1 Tax=Avena sativa TaxID=4498 RepID=A0ACD5WVI7_AVESA
MLCIRYSGDPSFRSIHPRLYMRVRQVQVDTYRSYDLRLFFDRSGRERESMGSCSSKADMGSAVVHPYPWSTPTTLPAPGQRVAVRMLASEFHALRAAAAGDTSGGDADVVRAILEGCVAGRWTWSPASSS